MSVRRLIVDDVDPTMIYSGTWTNGTTVSTSTNEYNSTHHRSGTIGDSVLFKFQGIGIEVYATLDRPATFGVPSPLFTIDNRRPVRFNETGDVLPEVPTDTTSHYVVGRFDGLSQGEHILNITVDNVSSSGPFFFFDFMVVTTNDLEAPGYVIIDDREAPISYYTYTEDWGQSGAGNEFEHTTTYSPSGPDSGVAMFTFNGTEVAVYGATSSTTSERAQIGFEIDGVDWNSFIINANSSHSQLLQATRLGRSEHTLVITQLASEVFYLDYLVYKTLNAEPEVVPVVDPDACGYTPSNSPPISIGGVVAGAICLWIILSVVLYFIVRKCRRLMKRTDQTPPIKNADDLPPYTLNQGANTGSDEGINIYGVGAERDEPLPAYYPRPEVYNTLNADSQQQQGPHHSEGGIMGLSSPNVTTGRPGEIAQPTQQLLPPGLVFPDSPLKTPSTLYSGGTGETTSRGEESGYPRPSPTTITGESPAPPYTVN
ncbi:hypothetical protein CPB86DRAFT_827141 [Serendipita vermifera]|nr:hypothetical protein CPB86DRAFT_827141 [Serendipita vermifera]